MKMVIDTDPGIDDAMAICFAALTPGLELLGLTSVFGNIPIAVATRNALRLCDLCGLNIPVAEGAATPLVRVPNPPGTFVHGDEGFGDIPAAQPSRANEDEDAADMLCRLAREHAGELIVCAIGPITNLAEAVRRDPGFAKNVKRVVYMGGAVFVRGNVNEFAEANVHNDPHALNTVIASGVPFTLVGLDVTMPIQCTAEDFRALERANPALGGFLNEASRFYLNFYRTTHGLDGCALHDPAAVIAALRPDLFEMRRLPIHAVEEGPEIGRTAVTDLPGIPEIDVCVSAASDAVKALFIDAFSRGAP